MRKLRKQDGVGRSLEYNAIFREVQPDWWRAFVPI
jgi:hypothetical protein